MRRWVQFPALHKPGMAGCTKSNGRGGSRRIGESEVQGSLLLWENLGTKERKTRIKDLTHECRPVSVGLVGAGRHPPRQEHIPGCYSGVSHGATPTPSPRKPEIQTSHRTQEKQLPVPHRTRWCPYAQEALQWAQTVKSQYVAFNFAFKVPSRLLCLWFQPSGVFYCSH